MSRFWLLLLALLMPLQTSWAAAHACSQDAAMQHAAAASTAVALQEHVHPPHDPAPTAAVDDCCMAAHGCHSLHTLMPLQPTVLGILTLSHRLTAADDPAAQGQFAARHERPQWSAA